MSISVPHDQSLSREEAVDRIEDAIDDSSCRRCETGRRGGCLAWRQTTEVIDAECWARGLAAEDRHLRTSSVLRVDRPCQQRRIASPFLTTSANHSVEAQCPSRPRIASGNLSDSLQVLRRISADVTTITLLAQREGEGENGRIPGQFAGDWTEGVEAVDEGFGVVLRQGLEGGFAVLPQV